MPLVHHFLKTFAEEHPNAPSKITQGAIESLMEYDWPGNVRELENTLESAVVMAEEDLISEEHLSIMGDLTWDGNSSTTQELPELTLKDQLELAERKILKRTLELVDGNRTRAAEILRISTRAIRYKIKQYEL